MQTNETEMGYIATFNHICKKKHIHTFCMFPQIILIVALEIKFFSFNPSFKISAVLDLKFAVTKAVKVVVC